MITTTTPTPSAPYSRRSIQKTLLHFLIAKFPNTFLEKERRPLKIGIAEDVLSWFEDHPKDQIPVTTALLTSTLGTYTSSPKYLLCLHLDAPRLDLAGQTVGKVTAEEADHAKNKLETLHHTLSDRHLKKKLMAQAEAAKRAEALRQKADKVAKQKKAPPPQSNPKSDLSVSTLSNSQSLPSKLQPVIRYIRKKLHVPNGEK